MTVLHPWALVLFPSVIAWFLWERAKTEAGNRLLLKAVSFSLVAAALAQPQVTIPERRVALALVADTSASVTDRDLRKENDLFARVQAEKGRNSLDFIPFDEELRGPSPGAVRRESDGRGTNLEVAIRDAIGRLPEKRVRRLLLVSDGQETAGSIERAIYQARLLGVPVDTVALEGRARPAFQLDDVSVQLNAFSGEKFPVEAVVTSPRATKARMNITAEGKLIGGAEVTLNPGQNRLVAQVQLNAEGPTPINGSVSAADLGESHFNRVVSLRRPRMLLVSKEPADAMNRLRQVIDAASFDVMLSTGPLPDAMDDYQLVLAVNLDLESWTEEQKRKVERYVMSGGGFALIAGENNIYAEHKDDADPVQNMLPANLTPPRIPEGNAVVLIVDKSSSMTGRKIELAKRSAIGVVENLRPFDLVGVLILDNSFQWAVPIHDASSPESIKNLISGIEPDGGTNIAPALREAFRQIRGLKAAYKHIVLLTDGISEEGDSMETAKEAAGNDVTISTIGLGEDVNREYLEKISQLAQGKSYFLLDFRNLEQLMLKDVEEHTGSSAIEKRTRVRVARDVEILEGVEMDKAPPLGGYLKFTAKPRAETILQVDGKNPLLTRWQYGLGRASVFASDAKARWAAGWLNWPGYDRLWTNLLRDLLPRSLETDATVEVDNTSNNLVVHYRFQSGVAVSRLPDLYVLGPNGFRKVVALKRVTSSSYEGHVPIGSNHGLFRIRAGSELEKFPEMGFYREAAESTQYGSNPDLLRQIAKATGGRFNPTPRQAFDSGNSSVLATADLWPGLLCFAVLFNLIELAERKGYRLPKWNDEKR